MYDHIRESCRISLSPGSRARIFSFEPYKSVCKFSQFQCIETGKIPVQIFVVKGEQILLLDEGIFNSLGNGRFTD